MHAAITLDRILQIPNSSVCLVDKHHQTEPTIYRQASQRACITEETWNKRSCSFVKGIYLIFLVGKRGVKVMRRRGV